MKYTLEPAMDDEDYSYISGAILEEVNYYHAMNGRPYQQNLLYPDVYSPDWEGLQCFGTQWGRREEYVRKYPSKPIMKFKDGKEQIMWPSSNILSRWTIRRKVWTIEIDDFPKWIRELGENTSCGIAWHGVETTVGWIPTQYDFPAIDTGYYDL